MMLTDNLPINDQRAQTRSIRQNNEMKKKPIDSIDNRMKLNSTAAAATCSISSMQLDKLDCID